MTPLQEASPAPVSNVAEATPLTYPAPSLACAPNDIFDLVAVSGELAETIQGETDTAVIRKATVDILLRERKRGSEAIEAAFALRPREAMPVTSAYTYLTDCLVMVAYNVATGFLHPNPTPTDGERLTLLGVGGYGRAEMAPGSDVDLLFLTPYKITPWAESVIESMLYILWDLRLKVGHSSRTVKDCVRLGREDITIRTALLEHRYIAGAEDLMGDLEDSLYKNLFKGTAAEFIEAKLQERAERHKKQGGQRYVVEPNVKEGKGGLRDLQTLFWVAKYLHNVDTSAELVALGVFDQEEYDNFVRAENFLWAVRCHLHLIAGRAMDTLSFDMQIEVADRMGYIDTAGRRAVELFMQDYFRHATRVGELTRIFLTSLEASHVKKEPLLVGLFKRKRKARDGFKIVQNRLTFANEEKFLADKMNILRIFEEGLRTGVLLHPEAMRVVASNLDLIDDDMRNQKEARRIFLDLMLKHGNPERALRRMNEIGVLGAFIPEFQEIVAMMQFNMYHHYTVDEHTIQCIKTLAQIERGELIEELPVASGILKDGINRKVLYVALLLHDIGKGRDEDHSIVGARIARKVAPRLGLKPSECKTVEWLVRNHLLMSDIAQKRDISDPRTVRGFAKAVNNTKQLDLLTVLTVCDIRGVGPGTWNNWKAMLLRDLHGQTTMALESGLEALNRETRETEAKKALRTALADWDKKAVRKEVTRHYPPYWQGNQLSTHIVFANMLKKLKDDEIEIDLSLDEDRDATRACFALVDHPGIFSRLAGALALVGANVVDARTYTTKDGYVTAIFWVQDSEGHPYARSRMQRLRNMIKKTLLGEVVPRDALVDRDKLKKREKAFKVPTIITFDNEGSEIYTIIEVDTRDRPGLLFDLTRTLANANVYIATATIATYGEQVVDTFYVKDMFGLKYHTKDKQKVLADKIRTAIAQGTKRALNG
ncbi:[protein-PII] uridylyltransferase [Halocynthiibacter sp. C4]|uniref:[protein-PII] uridylyltransferase n=1 Tax=Halocynthiibacter sp. C4 TaxID=2992758 RepID=UPI00237A9F15|nr:[protein-PII] uridylyltransferase [Halocynthiibacter sp. C4]MDE0590352.1 [protein-PII] uridylyltransferase [Halocynthiibacter sp. C4]